VSEEDRQANRFTPIEELPWQEETIFTGWLKDVLFLYCSCAKSLRIKTAARECFIWLAVTQR